MTKVLVFESDSSFAGELRTELGRLGASVQIVDDGNVGLQAATAARPDLILLSIELPRMNGFSVCNKLKKDPHLKDVPLVIMSSESSEETFEQHRKLRTRAEDYVHKPIAFGELLQHIRAFVPLEERPPDSAGIVIDDLDMALEDDPMASTTVQIGSPLRASVAPPPASAPQPASVAPAARGPEIPRAPAVPAVSRADEEIDNFIGGAFGHLLADDDQVMTTVKPLSDFPDFMAPKSKPPAPAAKGTTQDSGLHGKPGAARPGATAPFAPRPAGQAAKLTSTPAPKPVTMTPPQAGQRPSAAPRAAEGGAVVEGARSRGSRPSWRRSAPTPSGPAPSWTSR